MHNWKICSGIAFWNNVRGEIEMIQSSSKIHPWSLPDPDGQKHGRFQTLRAQNWPDLSSWQDKSSSQKGWVSKQLRPPKETFIIYAFTNRSEVLSSQAPHSRYQVLVRKFITILHIGSLDYGIVGTAASAGHHVEVVTANFYYLLPMVCCSRFVKHTWNKI